MNILPPTRHDFLSFLRYRKGAVWQKNKDKPVIIHNWADKYNTEFTNGILVSKRKLNKYYKFIGILDDSENNKKLVDKTFTSTSDDCVAYKIKCKCNEEMNEWSVKQVEKLWDMHICIE